MSTATAAATAKRKKKVASPCIKCCFWGVEKRQHDIELSIAVNRIAQLEAELQQARWRIPVKKEMCETACQTAPPEYDDVACQTTLPEYDDVACQTEEEEQDGQKYFTDTGTLIDGDEEDYQAWLLSKEEEDLSKDKVRVEEDVEILWYPTKDHKDVLFCAEALHPHFMGITTMCDDLYIDDGILSLQRLKTVCEELPFPYDDDEIRNQGHWYSLLHFLEARVPFWRSLEVDHTYSWYHTPFVEKEWVVERVYHFRFFESKNVFLARSGSKS